MKRGKKSLPIEVKKLRGTMQKCRIPKNHLQCESLQQLPDPPDHFREIHKQIYYEIGNRLLIMGIINRLNIHMFFMYCFFAGSHYECEIEMEDIKKHILVKYDDPGKDPQDRKIIDIRMHGLTRYSIECLKQARLLAAEFGLSPSSAQNIHIPMKETKSKFREYLENKEKP
ncbi:MAG: P27 family phage terminase small subunit [Bacteroidales bacterium]|nr:P27 family phage terminase small subunit [Bacteroidales bacterium]